MDTPYLQYDHGEYDQLGNTPDGDEQHNEQDAQPCRSRGQVCGDTAIAILHLTIGTWRFVFRRNMVLRHVVRRRFGITHGNPFICRILPRADAVPRRPEEHPV